VVCVCTMNYIVAGSWHEFCCCYSFRAFSADGMTGCARRRNRVIVPMTTVGPDVNVRPVSWHPIDTATPGISGLRIAYPRTCLYFGEGRDA